MGGRNPGGVGSGVPLRPQKMLDSRCSVCILRYSNTFSTHSLNQPIKAMKDNVCLLIYYIHQRSGKQSQGEGHTIITMYSTLKSGVQAPPHPTPIHRLLISMLINIVFRISSFTEFNLGFLEQLRQCLRIHCKHFLNVYFKSRIFNVLQGLTI